ncbi:MAG: glycosyltransferase family 4 protein [Okeania sp. SIO3I5]|uniref:glycosyltransferase family 4 protein n=1 Tax=Okeania sp. SIO3I5 TaxID=2607805 RepID=UPI0013B980C7|nr:glycosyltransferase family 4 protein [Okeania sp. SIO3I5]NEQ39105.1 glycosyltransferase family 4 protein [Okeania sp. SIO3I5]
MNKSSQLRILMIPSDCRPKNILNPYQLLLTGSLEALGVYVDNWPYCQGKLPVYKAAVARKKSFDVVHVHWIYSFFRDDHQWLYLLSSLGFILDICICRITGLKIVWTVHNSISHDSKFPGLELWTRRQFVKLVDRIICLNQMTLETIAQEYKFNPAKAIAIPHGHYRDVYQKPVDSAEAKKELNLPESGKVYLNLGLLRPYKGIENLLQVWQDNQDIFAGNTLLIVGKPWNEDYAQKLQDLSAGIDGVIIYPEFVDNNKLHLYFSAANVVILPLKKILNSGSLILAMSFGKPVIAPRLGGIVEVLREANDLLYDPEDKEGLLKAMQKSTEIDLDELSRLVIKACDRLDWDLIGQQTMEVYSLATGMIEK